jgi:hypothetical protein
MFMTNHMDNKLLKYNNSLEFNFYEYIKLI